MEKNLRQAISRSIKHPPLVGVSCHFPYGSARSRGVSLSDTHTAQGVSGADGIAIISSPSIPAGGFCKLIPEHNIQAMHASAESPHVDKVCVKSACVCVSRHVSEVVVVVEVVLLRCVGNVSFHIDLGYHYVVLVDCSRTWIFVTCHSHTDPSCKPH